VDSVDRYEAQLPAELGSVVAARRLVDSAMASWGISGTAAEDAALVVSELVTNAVLHTGTVLSVRVRRLDRGVQLEVQDGSTQPPVMPIDQPDDQLAASSMTGRGLALLAATVDRWGTDPRPDGKVVWAEIGSGARRLEGARTTDAGGPESGTPAAPPITAPPITAAATVIPARAAGGRPVRLIGVPVGLLIESVQQFADLQRELQVVGLDHNGPRELVALAESNREISARVGSLRQAGASVAEAARARGEAVVDFDVDVADGSVEAFDRLGSLIGRMDDTFGRRHLLSLPPSEEVTAFRRWYRDEISSQLRGGQPRPCPFTPASA
jgi:anti-sigma regulatory factor (Ser/Thr protein kinase)